MPTYGALVCPSGEGVKLKHSLIMATYEDEMTCISSAHVVPDTLDESPMAYESMDEIVKISSLPRRSFAESSPFTTLRRRSNT